jgi:hypothetical protein
MPVRETLKVLFKNRRHPLNLQRQFIARWESAPSKRQAFLSYIVYLAALSTKTLKFATKKLL